MKVLFTLFISVLWMGSDVFGNLSDDVRGHSKNDNVRKKTSPSSRRQDQTTKLPFEDASFLSKLFVKNHKRDGRDDAFGSSYDGLDNRILTRRQSITQMVGEHQHCSTNNNNNNNSTSVLDVCAASMVRLLGGLAIGQSVLRILRLSSNEVSIQLLLKFFSQESVDAVKSIKEILTEVHKEHGVVDVFALYRKADILLSVYALHRLQRAALAHQRKNDKSHHDILSRDPANQDLLNNLAHYAIYANAAYGWKMDLAMRLRLHVRGDLQALLRKTGVTAEDVVVARWEARAHRPAYFIVRDPSKRAIVLCVRGTWSAHDLLTNLCCTSLPFENKNTPPSKGIISDNFTHYSERFVGKVRKLERRGHHGMLSAALSLQKDVETLLLEELEANPGFSLVLVGHSLGGGVVALLGTLLEPLIPNLRVFAYGAPCVVPKHAKLHRNIVSVIAEKDPFRCLSLGHVAEVSRLLANLCEDPMLRSDIFMRTNVLEHDMDDCDLEWCHDTYNDLRKNINHSAEKLYPPGRTLLLSGALPSLRPNRWVDRSSATLREVRSCYFRDLVISPRMIDISQHVPALYESTLRALALTLESTLQ